MSPHTQRARLLIQQRRYEQAERELGRALGEDPDDGSAHAWLALSLASRKRFDEASQNAQRAVALAPVDPQVWAIAAHVALVRNDLDECERLANGATALDPHNVWAYVTRASALAQRKKWAECLAVVEQALSIDPEETTALNLRALANRGLGRKERHGEDIREALKSDPEDATTHANAGWASLERGDVAAAETHFREAMRLDPTIDWARVGVIETTKAKFPVYRWFLNLMLRLQKLSAGKQLGLIIGVWLGVVLLGRVAVQNPTVMVFALPVLLAYLAFCVASWFWRPVSNAALLLHPFARLALTPGEKASALVVTAIFLGLGSLFVGSIVSDNPIWPALLGTLLAPGLAVAFACQSNHSKPRGILLIAGGVLLANNAWILYLVLAGEDAQRALPAPIHNLTFGLLKQIREWGTLGVLFGAQWLSGQHWRAE